MNHKNIYSTAKKLNDSAKLNDNVDLVNGALGRVQVYEYVDVTVIETLLPEPF